jgi:hypothetical protein
MTRALTYTLLGSALTASGIMLLVTFGLAAGWQPEIRHSEERVLSVFGHRIAANLTIEPKNLRWAAPATSPPALSTVLDRAQPGMRWQCVVVR